MSAAIDRLLRVRRERPFAFFAIATLVAFAIRVAAIPFGVPATIDVFAYTLKATEIARGFYTPIETHAIGWSVALVPFVALVHGSMADKTTLARLASSACGALGVLPLSIVAAETVDELTALVTLTVYIFSFQLIQTSTGGWSEPLHALLLLGAVAGALTSCGRPFALVGGAVAAGAAFWVHPTGLLVIPIALVLVAMRAPAGRRVRSCAVALAVAVIVMAPAAWQRFHAFGSPIDFGENNRVFADTSEDMWSAHLPIPTLRDFVSRHSVTGIADRVLVRGFGNEMKDLAIYSLTWPVVPFAIVGLGTITRRRRLRGVAVALAIFYAAWALPYYTLGSARHLAPALPLALLVAAAGLTTLTARTRRPSVWVAAVLVVYVGGYSIAAILDRRVQLRDRAVAGLEWSDWIATHVRGRVAMIDGQELVMMHLPDATVGGVDINTMYAPETGLSLVRPGNFKTLDAALAWLRQAGATHLVVDQEYDFPRYFDRLREDPAPPGLTAIYASNSRAGWPVRIFAFDASAR